MTSTDVAEALVRELNYVGAHAGTANAPVRYTFARDFDSLVCWPDLSYDTASPSARYQEDARSEVLAVLDAAGDVVGRRAPRALEFVNAQMDTALIRRSDTIDGASSSSNRALVGSCLLTNIHVPSDRVYVCIEALVHESIHQYLYRTELAEGYFCDLGEARTYRSPWSGNRIPLHSLVHATFVWYGLLTLWCQLAQSVADREESMILRDRVSRILFGFAFVRGMIESPAFPKNSVQPTIAALIGRLADVATAVGKPSNEHRTLGEALEASENGGWIGDLTASLRRFGAAR